MLDVPCPGKILMKDDIQEYSFCQLLEGCTL